MIGLTVLFAAFLLSSGKHIRPNLLTRAIGLVFLAPILSLGFTNFSDLALALSTLTFVVLFSIVAQALDVRGSRQVVWTVVILACAQASLSIAQVLTAQFATWGFLGDAARALVGVNELAPALSGARAVGSVAHPILLGMFCAIGLTALGSRFLRAPIALRLLLGGLLVLGLAASGTRSAAAAALAGSTAALLFSARSQNPRFRLFRLVAVGGCAVAAVASLFVFTGLQQSLLGSFSLQHRQNSLRGAVELLDQSLQRVIFGHGPRGSEIVFELGLITDDGFRAVDNQWVWSLAVGGIVQVAALLLMIGYALVQATSIRSSIAVVFLVISVTFDFLAWSLPLVIFIALLQVNDKDERTDHVLGDRKTAVRMKVP